MQTSEQRRTEAAIRQTQLLCDAAVYPGRGKPRIPPTTAFKALTGEKSVAACYSARVGIAYEDQGKPCSQYSLLEYSTALISDFTLFLAEVCFLRLLFCSFFKKLHGVSVFFLIVCRSQISTNIGEVCEERAALASIHARCTPGFLILLWDCDPNRGILQRMLPTSALLPRCFHVSAGHFEDIFG